MNPLTFIASLECVRHQAELDVLRNQQRCDDAEYLIILAKKIFAERPNLSAARIYEELMAMDKFSAAAKTLARECFECPCDEAVLTIDDEEAAETLKDECFGPDAPIKTSYAAPQDASPVEAICDARLFVEALIDRVDALHEGWCDAEGTKTAAELNVELLNTDTMIGVAVGLMYMKTFGFDNFPDLIEFSMKLKDLNFKLIEETISQALEADLITCSAADILERVLVKLVNKK